MKSPNATSMHFNFNEFKIPSGAEVFIYSPDHQYVAGKYDQRSVLPDGGFYAQDIPGEEMILEYYQPVNVEGAPAISIYQVGHMYRETTNDKGYHGDAVGTCHINAICPEVDPKSEYTAISTMLDEVSASDNKNRLCKFPARTKYVADYKKIPFNIFLKHQLILVRELGFEPDFSHNDSSGQLFNIEAGSFLESEVKFQKNSHHFELHTINSLILINNSELADCQSISFTDEEQASIIDFFIKYISYHLEKSFYYSGYKLIK